MRLGLCFGFGFTFDNIDILHILYVYLYSVAFYLAVDQTNYYLSIEESNFKSNYNDILEKTEKVSTNSHGRIQMDLMTTSE